MTSTLVRLYALVAAVLVFFVAWAVVAAHPWQPPRVTAADRQVTALAELRSRVRLESLQVQRIVDRRFAAYAGALPERERTIALLRALNARRAAPTVSPPSGAAPSVSPPSGAAPPVAPPVVVSAPAVSTTHTS